MMNIVYNISIDKRYITVKKRRKVKMKNIEKFEQAIKNKTTYAESGINYTMINAYVNSKTAENEILNFDDIIWEKDVLPIINECDNQDIEYITISSSFSGLVEMLKLFQDYGCEIIKMVEVKSKYRDAIPAVKIRISK
jgi:hypothetical protein